MLLKIRGIYERVGFEATIKVIPAYAWTSLLYPSMAFFSFSIAWVSLLCDLN